MYEDIKNSTPMFKQYSEIKKKHPDKILFFRVGDFYETFFEDAHITAEILKITLTSKNQAPMAGIPYHASNNYLKKLIDAGKKVAICEQLEDAALAKGLVKRDITRIITPGTFIDENFIKDFKENNFLCSIYGDNKKVAIAFFDFSAGCCYCINSTDNIKDFKDELLKFNPNEIISNKHLPSFLIKSNLLNNYITTYYDDSIFLKHPDIDINLKIEDNLLVNALCGAINYFIETEGFSNPSIHNDIKNILDNIRIINNEEYLDMDDYTIRNLELISNIRDQSKDYSLFSIIDRTITSAGSRLLKKFLLFPLRNISKINERLDYIEFFYNNINIANELRYLLKNISDLERLSVRIALKKIIPRDIIRLSNSLKIIKKIKELLKDEVFDSFNSELNSLDDIVMLIEKGINEDPPSTFEGEVIKKGYNEEFDRILDIINNGKKYILELEEREKKRSGINSLKIKYNNISGYFIEITKANINRVPEDYIKKQSLVNAERYTIKELTEYEGLINSSIEKLSKLEEELFLEIVNICLSRIKEIRKNAEIVSLLDVYSSLAVLAKEENYRRPQIEDSLEIEIINGRHPVVEKYIAKNEFIPNDLYMNGDSDRILIITGPNMAGKSTYLRQSALIIILAQMGSFVPADKARIGIVDKIFTRIGASDNLSQGQSTFMVEMQEASNILRNSTSKSFIIMDELGRGTSTYDGLSLAWAIIEYLYENKNIGGRTLFSTHYQEITVLAAKKGIKNFNIAVKEINDDLIFLRKVVEGPADKSYGIHVAKLAGIPSEVIEKAKITLELLESEGDYVSQKIEKIIDNKHKEKQKGLFDDIYYYEHEVIKLLAKADINFMTPLEALNFLAMLKKKL